MTPWLLRVVAMLAVVEVARGQAAGHQTVRLELGWNAVYLSVDPDLSDPNKLLDGLPVDVVAAYAPSDQGAQFVSDPDASLLNAYGWSVWYEAARPDAFLTSLHAIYGGKAYLIHATAATTWNVQGTPSISALRWTPDAFNFVGFSVNTPGGPTFRQFFESSPAHNHNRIYRMVNGLWKQVLTPGTAVMRSGEGFWIYCDGHSDYPGPLEVHTDTQLGLVLSSGSGSELVLRNRTGHPLGLTLEHSIEGNDPVPLAVSVRGYDETDKVLRALRLDLGSGNWTQGLPTLDPGAAIRLPFEIRLQDMTPGTRHSMLTVRTDMGTFTTVPVTASRDDKP